MHPERKRRIRDLLKGIETGDPESVKVVDESRYIQHNPQTHEGSEGLAQLFARLSKSNPRVNVVRMFADGDYVFGHTEYDFATRRIGFEVFRFDGDFAVEHWDNIQPRFGPNHSGRSMVDGPTEPTDLGSTESNRKRIQRFVDTVLIGQHRDILSEFVAESVIEHSPDLEDGIESLEQHLRSGTVEYQTRHRLLAEGSFVLSVCEGTKHGVHTSFYDLFRIEDNRIVEHWDTVEAVPPREEWKNDNGKF